MRLSRSIRVLSFTSIACAAALLGAGSALAGERLARMHTVVELYTSSGCSACPSADDFFHKKLAGRTDILPLAFHVDYWDYLGWKDEFAKRMFSDRQRNYAVANDLTMIYTPQMVIGGQEFIVGHKRNIIQRLIEEYTRRSPGPLPFTVAFNDSEVIISAENDSALGLSYTAYLIHFLEDSRRVHIKSGENANRTILYANIVDSIEKAGSIGGPNFTELRVQAAPIEGKATAVIIHEDIHGKISWVGRLLP